MSCGQGAGAGAGVSGVDGGVGEAVKSHGRGTSGEHGNDDPEKLMSGGKAGGGEHGSAESEWEREDGVLPLDHFQRGAEVVKDRHRKIVRQRRRSVWEMTDAAIKGCSVGYPAPAVCEKLAGTPPNGTNDERCAGFHYFRSSSWTTIAAGNRRQARAEERDFLFIRPLAGRGCG